MNNNSIHGSAGSHMNNSSIHDQMGIYTMESSQANNKQACAQWNDEKMLGDLLDTEKHIASEYGNYVIEGSCQPFRQVLLTNLDETYTDQFQVFQQMQQRGWYPTKTAQQQDVQTAKQKFTQTKSQLM